MMTVNLHDRTCAWTRLVDCRVKPGNDSGATEQQNKNGRDMPGRFHIQI
jgi:hypothetical protein